MTIEEQLVEAMARAANREWWEFNRDAENAEYIDYWQNQSRNEARAALTALRKAEEAVGLVTVPAESTDEMIDAGLASDGMAEDVSVIYTAMLSAAPKPPGSIPDSVIPTGQISA